MPNHSNQMGDQRKSKNYDYISNDPLCCISCFILDCAKPELVELLFLLYSLRLTDWFGLIVSSSIKKGETVESPYSVLYIFSDS